MFIVIKNGKEIGAMYYFGDALASLLKAYKEQRTVMTDQKNILSRTFITMVVDEKEQHDITVPVAKEIGRSLKIIKAGKVIQDIDDYDQRKIYTILVNKGLIKKIL